MAKMNDRGRNDKRQNTLDLLAALRAQLGDTEEEKEEKARLEAERKQKEDLLAVQKHDRAVRAMNRAPGKKDAVENKLRTQVQHEKVSKGSGSKASQAKAAGLKSTFCLPNGELLMTAFGRGNDAIPEKHIVGDVIETIPETPAFSAKGCESGYLISGRVVSDAVADNPLASSKRPGQDLIGLKDQLETMIFGGTFEDNIHIQIAYNILDIDKILSIHINNIIYELNNLMRAEGTDDLFEHLGFDATYEAFCKKEGKALYTLFRKLMDSPQLCYFGNILYDAGLIKNLKKARNPRSKELAVQAVRAKEEEAYNLLSVLGMLRQSLAHGDTMPYTMDLAYDRQMSKKADHFSPQQRIAARCALESIYKARVTDLNTDFLDKAKVDLKILFSIQNAVMPEDKARIVRNYYDFIVRKDYKNQGFSIKHLRELMLLEPEANQLLSTDYDSMRARLYRAFDFIIFEHYRRHEEEVLALVESLRGNPDEAAKEKAYELEAKRIWQIIRLTVLNELLSWMNGDELAAVKTTVDSDLTLDMIKDVAIQPTATGFSEIVYLMTHFLDGKEINDLLTTLINKFENIASLLAVSKQQGLKSGFSEGYNMFGRSGMIAKELRAINNFARMAKEPPEAKKILFVEAAKVLGYPGDEEALNKYIDSMLTEDGEFKAKGKDFRNFIAKNVIESDRFKYLVRYGNVANIRQLANNSAVLAFVLRDIPDTQIIRYYNSCTGSSRENCTPDMRDKLSQIMTGISFETFSKVRTNNRTATREDQIEKIRMQAVVRLYLTVLYLLVKNLVYVNSRYFLAFHCVERDSFIYDRERFDHKSIKDHFSDFARERLEAGVWNKRVTAYIRQNFDNSNTWLIREFRNQVDHLNAVRLADRYLADIRGFSSYFELYHYLMQRRLIDVYASDKAQIQRLVAAGEPADRYAWFPMDGGKFTGYFHLVEKHHSYCKDLVKALNVPFSYNLPRYKNLSINDLFDRNHYLPAKAKNALAPEQTDEEE